MNSEVSYPINTSQCNHSAKIEHGDQSIFFPNATFEINAQSEKMVFRSSSWFANGVEIRFSNHSSP
ncbi:MAG: hypothetical protein H7329_00380 [Opitutaceae bacterium]|nr:hypothetical protein [Cytophagales bacterium]